MRFWRKKKQEDAAPEQAEALQDDALAEGDFDEAAAEAFFADQAFDDEVEEFEELTPEEAAIEQAEVQEQTQRAVERTKRGFFGRLTGIFERSDFDDSLWDELEEVLVSSDAGLATTEDILAAVRAKVKQTGVKRSGEVREILREELIAILEAPRSNPASWEAKRRPKPLIMLVVGVNGAGKTTSIAKMAHAFKNDGASVILGAADTFRAAASDQLKVWGDRAGVRVISLQPGADPGAVVFDTLKAAQGANSDIVLIDTAGRLQTKTNLMEELKKIDRIIKRTHPDGPHETLLVLDATTGQNGMSQAKAFTEAVGVTGIVLAKLDGTAKGGVAIPIRQKFDLPVVFVGKGETEKDLERFDVDDYVEALFNFERR